MGESPLLEAAHHRRDHGFAGLAHALMLLAEPPVLTEPAEVRSITQRLGSTPRNCFLAGGSRTHFEVAHRRVLGLLDCLRALGWVPWVCVFDNMETITSGPDVANQPLWTPALRQLRRVWLPPAGL